MSHAGIAASRKAPTLRDIRTNQLRWTQAQFAQKIGVSTRTLARYEQSGRPPPTALRLINMMLRARGLDPLNLRATAPVPGS